MSLVSGSSRKTHAQEKHDVSRGQSTLCALGPWFPGHLVNPGKEAFEQRGPETSLSREKPRNSERSTSLCAQAHSRSGVKGRLNGEFLELGILEPWP